jgi:hypothetical protein
MYIDRRHKYFVYALTLVAVIVVVELLLPGLAWWQRWLFVYAPIGVAIDYLARYMGWYQPEPKDEWDAMTPEQRAAERFGSR